MHFRVTTNPVGFIVDPDTSLISPAWHDPSSTSTRCPNRNPTMSCSRDTRSAVAGTANTGSARGIASAMKVRGKVFVFLFADGKGLRMTVKLPLEVPEPPGVVTETAASEKLVARLYDEAGTSPGEARLPARVADC